ncbi:MAG: MBL fold metallo-hydrolase [Desulfarculaceae bacterium]|nr:MBL fold metallo-hydrolase [Desulfarculaceae bacterium]MCF8070933.1 MBL fold metallo-hydrolase [Desulfarculaceae bacterium]MCF8100521.1 MBL fold metallo-hydrolase [Desulfarculaceae bacterium]MCF8116547.1 MBL fold metallo-hydrolase [Desulfarculaceae bacterium]
MELIFLGTGGAWGLPEHQCPCATCRHLRSIGQYRTRTSLWLEGPARVLIDPGPDLRAQLMREDLPRPDAVLITHEHGDHYLGLDELLCYRRNVPPDAWEPIPVYASAEAWEQIEARFGYLLGSLLEKRLALPGAALSGAPFGPNLGCTPVKTDHGPIPKGSLGYRFELATPEGPYGLGYTSDMTAPLEPDAFAGLDLLVCQCHFVHEPAVNRANHLSLQRALPQLLRWQPGRVYLAHLSCQDHIPGDDPANAMLKKYAPAEPLRGADGEPYAIPRDHAAWQALVERALPEHGLTMPVTVAFDGLRVPLPAGG